MPRPMSRRPKYCHHKASDRAFVVLNGEFIYLGKHGTPESRDRYDQIIGEWIARGRMVLPKPTVPSQPDLAPSLTVSTLVGAYWQHVKTYYILPNGTPTHEQENIRYALRPLRRLYGATAASEFGPLKLKAVREEMVKSITTTDQGMGRTTTRPGWSRSYANRQIARIKSAFKWATENEMISPSVYHGLATVRGLRKHRSEARETEPVKPVKDELVDAVVPLVSPAVAAMIQLQRLTGMRSGEVVVMRGCDLEKSGATWIYRPAHHKTAHHGHERVVHLGRKAQKIIKRFLRSDLDAFLFNPIEAEMERRDRLHKARKTPPTQGNAPGDNRSSSPTRSPGDRYTVASYRRAIARGCEKAFPPPPPLAKVGAETVAQWRSRLTDQQKGALKRWTREHQWHPHQLRHSAATELRRRFGIETARVILGHRSPAITDLYAEVDVRKAADAMAQVG